MNTSYFRSRTWIPAAILIVAAFVVWWKWGDVDAGRDGANSHRGFLLITGWVSLGLFLAVAAYAGRKWFPRRPVVTPGARRTPFERIEDALIELKALEDRENRKEERPSLSEVRKKAATILRSAGVWKAVRPHVRVRERGTGSKREKYIAVKAVPARRGWSMLRWMRMHLFLGTAAGALVILHSGFRGTLWIGLLLDWTALGAVVTGLGGIVLWAVWAGGMSRAERELTYEATRALEQHFERNLDDFLHPVMEAKPQTKLEAALESAGLRLHVPRLSLALKERRPPPKKFLEDFAAHPPEPEVRADVCELAEYMGIFTALHDERVRLQRHHRWLQVWRLVHVPLSILLLFLVAVHVISTWRY